jgi:hypothetical protein
MSEVKADASLVKLLDREPAISLALYHLFKWGFVSPLLHT